MNEALTPKITLLTLVLYSLSLALPFSMMNLELRASRQLSKVDGEATCVRQ